MKALSFIVLIPMVVACSGATLSVGSDQSGDTGGDGGDGGGKTSCTASSDCPSGQGCAFEKSHGCGAPGVCLPMGAVCNISPIQTICACDGTLTPTGCANPFDGQGPGDYNLKTASPEPSGCTANVGKDCTTTADCGDPTQYMCGFQESDACAAKGKCFYTGGEATCAAFSAGCACDGTEINIACSPLPSGYSSKPLAYAGNCTDGGSGAQDGGL